jgi:hypothetical protein
VDDAAVDALCLRLAKLLSADGEMDDGQGDGKDYVVQLRDIRLGFGARMLLQKTDFILERNHRCALQTHDGPMRCPQKLACKKPQMARCIQRRGLLVQTHRDPECRTEGGGASGVQLWPGGRQRHRQDHAADTCGEGRYHGLAARHEDGLRAARGAGGDGRDRDGLRPQEVRRYSPSSLSSALHVYVRSTRAMLAVAILPQSLVGRLALTSPLPTMHAAPTVHPRSARRRFWARSASQRIRSPVAW